ncbi:hypothetical protein PIB30_056305 [Stylosanthes scabra]|uniref:Protein FAR1-RELATED SEQUENCE n=1 Tax=Stylosanthes scabra TaxID=79078 RepID=A0ABU6QK24_9FABA|nr:hypothetical protein [Stylosanthes scabra]
MWVPMYFHDEFWVSIRSTQRSESMHAFYGRFLYTKTSLIKFVHEFDNILDNKEQKELEDDAADFKGVVQYGDMYSLEVEEQKLVFDKPVFDTYKVSFDLVSHECRCDCNMFQSKGICKNVRPKHTYIKSSHDVNLSDKSHNLFRGLHNHFYNVAQDFLCNKEEALILHSSMDDLQIKLGEHCASKLQSSIHVQQSCRAHESQCSISVNRLQGPSLVSTKGCPTKRRLGLKLGKVQVFVNKAVEKLI